MLVKLIDKNRILPARRGAEATPEGRAALAAEGYRVLLLSTEPRRGGGRPAFRYEALGDYVVRLPAEAPAP